MIVKIGVKPRCDEDGYVMMIEEGRDAWDETEGREECENGAGKDMKMKTAL